MDVQNVWKDLHFLVQSPACSYKTCQEIVTYEFEWKLE